MNYSKEKNDHQVVVLVPFKELKEELIDAVRKEIQGLQKESIPKEESNRQFYNPLEVRELFQISRSTLHNWKQSGMLVPCKIGGKVLYSKQTVEQVIYKKLDR